MDYDKRKEPTFGKSVTNSLEERAPDSNKSGLVADNSEKLGNPAVSSNQGLPYFDRESDRPLHIAVPIFVVIAATLFDAFLRFGADLTRVLGLLELLASQPLLLLDALLLPFLKATVIPTFIVLLLLPFKFGKRPKIRRLLFTIIPIITAALFFFSFTYSPSNGRSNATLGSTTSDNPSPETEQPQANLKSTNVDTNHGGVNYSISEKVLQLEAEAKALPRAPFMANLYTYQRVKNELEMEFARHLSQRQGTAANAESNQITNYQNKVKQKLAFYESKIAGYNELMRSTALQFRFYMGVKQTQKTISESCGKVGIDMRPLFSQVDRIDSPAEQEATRVLVLAFGRDWQQSRDEFLTDSNFLKEITAAKNTLFSTLRGLSGKNMDDRELCEVYLNNNIHRAARKAFVNQFPERYQALREIQ